MQRGKILALDVATKTGVAEGRPGEVPRLATVDFRGDSERSVSRGVAPCGVSLTDLYGRATLWMAEKMRDNKPDLVVIEQTVPAFGHTNYQTSLITHGLFGIMCGIASAKGIRIEIAPIKTWRKCFLGKGDYPGIIAKQMCVDRCKLLGWDAIDHNAAEAAGIFEWACQTFMGRIPEALHLFGEKAS